MHPRPRRPGPLQRLIREWTASGRIRPPANPHCHETDYPDPREIKRRRKGSLDRRVYQRLTAVLAIAADKSRQEVADLLGIGLTQLGEWLRVFRNQGLDALCTLHYTLRGQDWHIFKALELMNE